MIGYLNVRHSVARVEERLQEALNHWQELTNEPIVLRRAQVTEQADDDDVVVVSHKCGILGLLDAEDEDREEYVLGADVVRPLQGLLADVEREVHEGLLQLLPRQSIDLISQRLVLAGRRSDLLLLAVAAQALTYVVKGGL